MSSLRVGSIADRRHSENCAQFRIENVLEIDLISIFSGLLKKKPTTKYSTFTIYI